MTVSFRCAALVRYFHMIDKGFVLITGGAGFIGTNLADQLCRKQEPVLILDNLSRSGSARNLEWLRKKYGQLVSFVCGDIRDPLIVREAVNAASCVYHFAAQVAVTDSLIDPVLDFDVNLRGTLNLLEALRHKPAVGKMYYWRVKAQPLFRVPLIKYFKRNLSIMPEAPDYSAYHRSLTEELYSLKDRIRNLVSHWPTDGEHKEVALRSVLRRHLPQS